MRLFLLASRLSSVEEFENIILKSDTSGANVYLKDVARVERGAESYDIMRSVHHGFPASGLGLSLGTGSERTGNGCSGERAFGTVARKTFRLV
ncbi:efflux RND transporter permease subunit [Vibrio sp. M60_M31a]